MTVEDNVARYVTADRCAHCGHKQTTWTPQNIVDAARAWTAEHGEPPRQRDWTAGTPDHPAFTAVFHIFGGWRRMLNAAELPVPTRSKRNDLKWTRDEIADAMLDWFFRTGSWPTTTQWRGADGTHPAERTVRDRFGSWAAAKKYAGWAPTEAVVEQRCTECGTDLENVTTGCKRCHDRSRRRARRRSATYLLGSQASPRAVPAAPGGADFANRAAEAA